MSSLEHCSWYVTIAVSSQHTIPHAHTGIYIHTHTPTRIYMLCVHFISIFKHCCSALKDAYPKRATAQNYKGALSWLECHMNSLARTNKIWMSLIQMYKFMSVDVFDSVSWYVCVYLLVCTTYMHMLSFEGPTNTHTHIDVYKTSSY